MSGSLIREYHETTEDDGKIKIINTAVKLIKKNDISFLEIHRSVYPSITKMIDLDRQLELTWLMMNCNQEMWWQMTWAVRVT